MKEKVLKEKSKFQHKTRGKKNHQLHKDNTVSRNSMRSAAAEMLAQRQTLKHDKYVDD